MKLLNDRHLNSVEHTRIGNSFRDKYRVPLSHVTSGSNHSRVINENMMVDSPLSITEASYFYCCTSKSASGAEAQRCLSVLRSSLVTNVISRF